LLPVHTFRRLLTRRLLVRAAIALVALFALIQAIPYGWPHSNPPVVTRLAWDSPRTEQLARKYCLDCHSNKPRWPSHSNVAPISWLVWRDVQDGRGALNLSRWGTSGAGEGVGDIREALLGGSMPPWQYKLIHGGPSSAERQELAQGLAATLQRTP
jgi:hypothetical protein